MRGINHAEDFGWAAMARLGSESTPSTTTSTSAPWAGQQPYLQGLFGQAQNLAQNYQPQYYGGNTYAPITDTQSGLADMAAGRAAQGGGTALQTANNALTAMQLPGYTQDTQTAFNWANPSISNLAGGGQLAQTSGAFGQGQNYLSNMLSGATLDPNSAPGFQSLVNRTMAQVMPATDASFIKSGRSDSGLASAARSSALSDSIGNLGLNYYLGQQQLQNSAAQQAAANQATGLNTTLGAANLASSNLLGQQGNQIKASGLAPVVDQAQQSALTNGISAAGLDQQNSQNLINQDVQRFNFNQMQPWNTAGMYQGLINGNYGSQGTATTPYYQNTLANALSAGTGLLGLNAATGSTGGGFGSTAIGSLFNSLFK
jgi:hypothetical protein